MNSAKKLKRTALRHNRFQELTFQVLEGPPPLTGAAFAVRWTVVGLVIVSTACVCLETVDSIALRVPLIFKAAEKVFVAVFAAEYILRMWCIVQKPGLQHPFWARLRYAMTPLAIVDLIAILPVLLTGSAAGLMTFRLLRLIRLFRLIKLARYSAALRSLGDALASKREEMVVVLSALCVLLLIASSLMYVVENEAQPGRFSSIPAAMWWGVATLTTVGYGDVYPITPLGKMIGAVIAVLGAGLFAMPAAIWGAAFVERIAKQHVTEVKCPHCGRSVERESARD